MAAAFPGIDAPPKASSHEKPEEAAKRFLDRLTTAGPVLIAYSGGGDSSGLLVALAEAVAAWPDCKVKLFAATVDHGLRAGSSEEAREAGRLSETLGIPHAILRWEGEKPRTGIQAAAREARYRLLSRHVDAIGARLIVTAHTLDDQIETLAMRRARNAEAATGMSEAVLYDRRLWIARPFLDVRREEIRAFLSTRKIGWVDDPSNDNTAFERIRVRKARSAGDPVPDFHALGGNRRAQASKVAQWLATNARIHSGLVGEVDLARFSTDEPAPLRALMYLAAFIGGRNHVAGRETAARVAAFLASAEKRLAADRVVFDRRKDRLFLVRERRLLPELTLTQSETGVWDNRFRVRNDGHFAVTIASRKVGHREPLISHDFEHLPGAVSQLVEKTEPVSDRPARLSIEPVIASFGRFLPFDVFEIANVLANLGGLAHFPEIPLR